MERGVFRMVRNGQIHATQAGEMVLVGKQAKERNVFWGRDGCGGQTEQRLKEKKGTQDGRLIVEKLNVDTTSVVGQFYLIFTKQFVHTTS
jgi:hypothetical protein